MNPPPSQPLSPQAPSPVSWWWLLYEYFRLQKRNSVYFVWAVILPVGTAYISTQVSGVALRDSDKTLLQWFIAYGIVIIPQSLFIVACLRVLFFSGQGLTLLGFTIGLWERRVMLLMVPHALLVTVQYTIEDGLHAWSQGRHDVLASAGAWVVWGLKEALFAMSLLALCYFAEEQNGKFMEALVQSWRNMRRHGLRVVVAFIAMLVVWQFIGEPLWLESILPTNAPINRVIAWVFLYYFYGVTAALMAYLAFRHIHPDDVLVLSSPINRE